MNSTDSYTDALDTAWNASQNAYGAEARFADGVAADIDDLSYIFKAASAWAAVATVAWELDQENDFRHTAIENSTRYSQAAISILAELNRI